MKCEVFRQRKLAIFAILVLSFSVVPTGQANSQLVDDLSFSNETNDLQFTTLYSTQQYDSLQISDSVKILKNNLEKNNSEIQAIVFDKNNTNDSVVISDSVILAKHVPIVYDSNWDSVAITERIIERTKTEKVSNVSANLLHDGIISDGLVLTNQNEIIQNKINLIETNTSLIDQLDIFENDYVVNISTQNIFENNIVTESFDSINSEHTFVFLLAPFAGMVLLLRNNFKFKQTNFKQFSSYVLIFILLSSAALTPVSISSSYWGFAYAELDESSEPIVELIEPISEFSDDIHVESTSDTSVESIDVTLTETEPTTEPTDESVEPVTTITEQATELTEEELEQAITEMMEEQAQKEAEIEFTNSTSTEVEPIDIVNATSTEVEPIDIVNATS
ncbi:MAG: hypothetical protein M8319_06070, partial [Nitrosopumilus sp.]|nr:hypothetical protein [Nitrosopumilus sp.]